MNHKTGCTLSWLTLNYSALAYLRLSSTPSFGHLGHFKESDMNWNTEQIWFSNYYFVKCMAVVYVIYFLTNRQWFSRCSVYHGGLSDRRNSDVLSWLSIMSFSFSDVLGEWASRHVSPMLLQGFCDLAICIWGCIYVHLSPKKLTGTTCNSDWACGHCGPLTCSHYAGFNRGMVW